MDHLAVTCCLSADGTRVLEIKCHLQVGRVLPLEIGPNEHLISQISTLDSIYCVNVIESSVAHFNPSPPTATFSQLKAPQTLEWRR